MAINQVCIAGNLTRNAELRFTNSGLAVLDFRLAINEKHKSNQTGEWEDEPVFVGCTMFGNRAQGVAPYMTKGTKVTVSGRLHYSEWMKNEERRSALSVNVNDLEFSGARRQNPDTPPLAEPREATPQAPAQAAPAPAVADPNYSIYDEDIPF